MELIIGLFGAIALVATPVVTAIQNRNNNRASVRQHQLSERTQEEAEKNAAEDRNLELLQITIKNLGEALNNVRSRLDTVEATLAQKNDQIHSLKDSLWEAVRDLKSLYYWVTRHYPEADPPRSKYLEDSSV